MRPIRFIAQGLSGMLEFHCRQLSLSTIERFGRATASIDSQVNFSALQSNQPRPKDKPLPDRAAHAVSFYQLTARQRCRTLAR